MGEVKTKKQSFMERQVYKVVSPMLAVCYAMYREAGGVLGPGEFADSVRRYLKSDDLPVDIAEYLKDYGEYMQKGN